MKILRQGEYSSFNNNCLVIQWTLSRMCNYKCSYCFGQTPIDKNKYSSLDELKHAVDVLESLDKDSYEITLTGGEATAHPYFLELISYIKKRLGERLRLLVLTSNGSRPPEWFKKLFEYTSDIPFSLNVSIHTEYIKADKIVWLIENASNNLILSFAFMLNPEKFDYIKELFSIMLALRKSYPFVLNFDKLLEPPYFDVIDHRYTENHDKFISESRDLFRNAIKDGPNKYLKITREAFWDLEDDNKITTEKCNFYDKINLRNKGLLNFEGMYCVTGSSTIEILPEGEVKGAICYAKEIVKNRKGNIFNGNPFENGDLISAIKCPYKYCACSLDYGIPKFYDKEEAESFIKSAKQ